MQNRMAHSIDSMEKVKDVIRLVVVVDVSRPDLVWPDQHNSLLPYCDHNHIPSPHHHRKINERHLWVTSNERRWQRKRDRRRKWKSEMNKTHLPNAADGAMNILTFSYCWLPYGVPFRRPTTHDNLNKFSFSPILHLQFVCVLCAVHWWRPVATAIITVDTSETRSEFNVFIYLCEHKHKTKYITTLKIIKFANFVHTRSIALYEVAT